MRCVDHKLMQYLLSFEMKFRFACSYFWHSESFAHGSDELKQYNVSFSLVALPLTSVSASLCLFMQPHVADGRIMHGGWVSIVLHMGSALQ